jgi:hypothetical protein
MIKRLARRGWIGTVVGLTGVVVTALLVDPPEATEAAWGKMLAFAPSLGLYWWGIYQFVKAKSRSGGWFVAIVWFGCAGPVVLLLLKDRSADETESTIN